MSSIINFLFPILQQNPIFKFQYVSDRITKIKSYSDLLAGLFYAYIEKLFELENNVSMIQLKANFVLALEIFKYKKSINENFEKDVPKFVKRTSEMMEELGKLCLSTSFLQKLNALNTMKKESKEIFALIPKILVLRDILKMIRREKRDKYVNLLEKVKKEILEDQTKSEESFLEISEFLKMIFANTFQTKINFYDLARFTEMEMVSKDEIKSYSPIEKSASQDQQSINILLNRKAMHSLWRKNKEFYLDLDKQFEKSLEEKKPIEKKAEKILNEFNKSIKEKAQFRSVVSKLLLITDRLLSDKPQNLNNEEAIQAFRSIRKKIRKSPGLLTEEMKDILKSIKDKINSEFSEMDTENDTASSLNDGFEEEKQNKEDMIEFLFPLKEEPPPLPPPPPLKISCPTCLEDYEVSEIRTFDCDHKACNNCAYNFLNAKYEAGDWSFDIPCFGECEKGYALRHPDSYAFLKEILGTEKVAKMSEKLANDQADFRCANKQCGFQCSLDPNQKDLFFCPQCFANTCIKCKELAHEGKACTALLVKMLEALGNSNENRLRVCPFCYEPYLKDQNCEHVKCLKCKNDWCFTCSVDREPTMTHGVHYHRRDCKQFKPWADEKNKIENMEEEFDPQKCERCKKNNKPCKRPISMKEFYEQIGFPLLMEKKEEKLE